MDLKINIIYSEYKLKWYVISHNIAEMLTICQKSI